MVSLKLRNSLVAASVVLASLTAVASASGNAYQVNTEADSLDGVCDSSCSLRDGVSSASSNPGADEVQVPPGHFMVDYGPIHVGDTEELEIEGINPRTVIIDAGGNSGVFVLDAGSYGELKRFSVTGGAAAQGAGIKAEPGSTTEMKQVDIYDNNATSQGGGIYNEGELEFEQALIRGNTAGDASEADGGQGGGIYNAGEMEAENLTVTNNKATGGTTNAPRGGGIFEEGGDDAEWRNVTVSNNTADSDGDGGGLAVVDGNDLTFDNSIVANNLADAVGTDNCSLDDSLTEQHNLENGTDCDFTGTGDKQGVDPLLGPLAHNQGFTDTRAIGAGSPALDSIEPALCPIKDQRTLSRPQGAGCDIGAFEVEVVVPDAPKPVAVAGAKALKVKLSGSSSQRLGKHKGVVVSVDCDQACNLAAAGSVTIAGGASRKIKLRKATKSLTAAGTAKLTLKLSRNSLASVKRALKKHKRVTASVSVQATGTVGNASSSSKIKLKP